jgi:hypothetical protein
VPVVTLPVTASLPLENAFVLEMKECINSIGAFNEDVSSFSSVSAARSTSGHKLLSPESQTAVSAIAGKHLNFRTINKEHSAPIHTTMKICFPLKKKDP